MQLRQRYLKAVSGIIAAGVVGGASLLGATIPAAASERAAQRAPGSEDARVSDRLAAVREAVFAVTGPESGQTKDPDIQLAWGNRWGNFGWGRGPGWRRPRWNNWRNGWSNWGNGWRNW